MKHPAPLLPLVTAAFAVILGSSCGQSSSGDAGNGGQSGTAGSASSHAGGSSAGPVSTGGKEGGSTGTAVSSGGTIPMTGGTAASSRTSSRAGATGTSGGTSGLSGGTTSDSGGSAVGGTSASSVPKPPDAGQDSRGDAPSRDSDAQGGTGGRDGSGNDTGVDPTKSIKVWLAGDSTVMKCTDACPCGWGSQFQSLLNSNATVVNSAVGGRSIQTWLYDPNVQSTMGTDKECVVSPKTYSDRWQKMLDPTDGMKPGDYLFIEFGINDGDSTCPRHVGTALFQSTLGTMAQAAKKAGAQPIFLTSTSYIDCSGSTAKTNRGFVAETKAAGTANSVPVIDLTSLSAALYTSQGLCPNGADYTSTTSAVGKFFCEDHTHFEAAGAAQIAKVVAKAIKDQGIGLAAFLR